MNGEANPSPFLFVLRKRGLTSSGLSNGATVSPAMTIFSKVNCRLFKNNDLHIRPVLWGTVLRAGFSLPDKVLAV
ncbi:hypothetical protein ACFSHR_00565 [Azotobacter chroococcum]